MAKNTIDGLLETPAWVVDIFPAQVPACAGERYFDAEGWLLLGRRGRKVRQAFADVLVKLGCYHDLTVYRDTDDKGVRNPSPKKLTKWVTKDKGIVNIVIEGENALVSVPDMSTCMAVHNAGDGLLALVRELAAASGLFVWQPPVHNPFTCDDD